MKHCLLAVNRRWSSMIVWKERYYNTVFLCGKIDERSMVVSDTSYYRLCKVLSYIKHNNNNDTTQHKTQHYTPLHYTTLHFTTLHSTTTQHYTTLHCTTLHITLYYTTLNNLTLHCTIMYYTTHHTLYYTLHTDLPPRMPYYVTTTSSAKTHVVLLL